MDCGSQRRHLVRSLTVERAHSAMARGEHGRFLILPRSPAGQRPLSAPSVGSHCLARSMIGRSHERCSAQTSVGGNRVAIGWTRTRRRRFCARDGLESTSSCGSIRTEAGHVATLWHRTSTRPGWMRDLTSPHEVEAPPRVDFLARSRTEVPYRRTLCPWWLGLAGSGRGLVPADPHAAPHQMKTMSRMRRMASRLDLASMVVRPTRGSFA